MNTQTVVQLVILMSFSATAIGCDVVQAPGAQAQIPSSDTPASLVTIVPAGQSALALGVTQWRVDQRAGAATVLGLDGEGATVYTQQLRARMEGDALRIDVSHEIGGGRARQTLAVGDRAIEDVSDTPLTGTLLSLSNALRADAQAEVEALEQQYTGAFTEEQRNQYLSGTLVSSAPMAELPSGSDVDDNVALASMSVPIRPDGVVQDWVTCVGGWLGVIGGGAVLIAVCAESWGLACYGSLASLVSLGTIPVVACGSLYKDGGDGKKRVAWDNCVDGEKCACFYVNEVPHGAFDVGGDYVCLAPRYIGGGKTSGYNLTPEFRKKISAVKLLNGATAQVYKGTYLTGDHIQLHSNTPWIGKSFNDSVQSVQIW